MSLQKLSRKLLVFSLPSSREENLLSLGVMLFAEDYFFRAFSIALRMVLLEAVAPLTVSTAGD